MKNKTLKRILIILAGCALAARPGAFILKAAEVVNIPVPVIVPPGEEYAVIDVLDGVEARYRTRDYYDDTGPYSCAGYVKAYYMAVHGIDVQNLFNEGPPHPRELFRQVYIPQKGDIIFYPSPPNRSNHSAVVKSFDGVSITIIEQNYRFAQAGHTFTYLNRTLPYPSEPDRPYEIWRLVSVEDEPYTEYVPPDEEPGEETEPVFPNEPGDTQEPVYNEPGDEPGHEPDNEPDNEPGDLPPPFYTAKVTIGSYLINVNGADMLIDAPAMIENERTILPVRWVAYALGLSEDDIYWDQPSMTVTVLNGGDVIQCVIGSYIMYVNGQPIPMDCPASIKTEQERTYLPVKFLADALDVPYIWNQDECSVTFYKPL